MEGKGPQRLKAWTLESALVQALALPMTSSGSLDKTQDIKASACPSVRWDQLLLILQGFEEQGL